GHRQRADVVEGVFVAGLLGFAAVQGEFEEGHRASAGRGALHVTGSAIGRPGTPRAGRRGQRPGTSVSTSYAVPRPVPSARSTAVPLTGALLECTVNEYSSPQPSERPSSPAFHSTLSAPTSKLQPLPSSRSPSRNTVEVMSAPEPVLRAKASKPCVDVMRRLGVVPSVIANANSKFISA